MMITKHSNIKRLTHDAPDTGHSALVTHRDLIDTNLTDEDRMWVLSEF